MISVYDIEVFPNLFVCSFANIETEEVKTFILSEWTEDRGIESWWLFVDYFKQHQGLIGYNNVDYDYRVLRPFIEADFDIGCTIKELLIHLYNRSGEVIDENFKEQYVVPVVPQRDLFKLWHFNNKAKMVSLKYLQINMGWRNVMESPYPFDKPVKKEWIKEIVGYNVNDVLSTLEFYKKSKNLIRLRKTMGEMYDVNMGNFSNSRMGEAIFVEELAKRTKRSRETIKKGRTPRKNIPARDCIVSDIEFESKEFKGILDQFNKLIITNTKKIKKTKDFTVYFDGVKYDFGMGGLHALRSPGIYHNVQSADVSSYYANLPIGHILYPQHLGPAFCDVYKLIYEERKKYGKKTSQNAGFKEALVCTFGQSNAPWSPFYDPKYTMTITISGQLLIAMLCEQLTLSGAARIIMGNTDGIECEVLDQVKFDCTCEAWQDIHKLELEYSKYKMLAIRDVNAYLGVAEDGEIKAKNDFEIEKMDKGVPALHKDHSMRIVPIAVRDYLIKGVPVEKTIAECEEIGKFLLGRRAKTGRLEYRTTQRGKLVNTKMPKNVRYYVSDSGGSLVKILKATEKQKNKVKKYDISPNQTNLFDVIATKEVRLKEVNRVVAVHKGYAATLFNLWEDKPFKEYQVNKQFYIREANKLINSVVQNQSTI